MSLSKTLYDLRSNERSEPPAKLVASKARTIDYASYSVYYPKNLSVHRNMFS